MCMLCDEEALYRAYLEHKAKVEAQAQADGKPRAEPVAQKRAEEHKTAE